MTRGRLAKFVIPRTDGDNFLSGKVGHKPLIRNYTALRGQPTRPLPKKRFSASGMPFSADLGLGDYARGHPPFYTHPFERIVLSVSDCVYASKQLTPCRVSFREFLFINIITRPPYGEYRINIITCVPNVEW